MSDPQRVAKIVPGVVSHRLEVLSVDLLLDEVMERLPRRTIPAETDEQRVRIRGWLEEIVSSVLYEMRWAVVKGAERGIDQVIELARDPDYYTTRATRRAQDRDRSRVDRARQQAESEKYRAEKAAEREKAEAETRELIASGKLRSITGGWELRDAATGKPVGDEPTPNDPPPGTAS